MSEYIPVYEYTKKYDTSKQNVYRWIREGKLKEGDYVIEEVVSQRIKIKGGLKPVWFRPRKK